MSNYGLPLLSISSRNRRDFASYTSYSYGELDILPSISNTDGVYPTNPASTNGFILYSGDGDSPILLETDNSEGD
jgi:hypothetical protein